MQIKVKSKFKMLHGANVNDNLIFLNLMLKFLIPSSRYIEYYVCKKLLTTSELSLLQIPIIIQRNPTWFQMFIRISMYMYLILAKLFA